MDVLENGDSVMTVDEEGQVLSASTGRAVKKIEYGDDGAFISNAVTGRREYFIPGVGGNSGGGGGAVQSVNGKTGDVQLSARDVGAYTKKEVDDTIGPVDEALDELLAALDVLVGA